MNTRQLSLVCTLIFSAVVYGNASEQSSFQLYKNSYALVIGVSEYENGWPKLPGVKQDVESVKKALSINGFTVEVVTDPNSQQLDAAFESFIQKYGNNYENRLLFYFAGHGHTLKPKYGGNSLGYILPVDAPKPEGNEALFKSKAMSMQRVEEYALNINSKHAMFMFDSCFSGSLFSLSRAIPSSISYKTAKPVRQFITSGSESETVPDQSIFRRQFIDGLNGSADSNQDGYVTGAELGEFLQTSVVNYSKNAQHPQYGKIRNPNLDKGDFVFKVSSNDINKIKIAHEVAIVLSKQRGEDENQDSDQSSQQDNSSTFASDFSMGVQEIKDRTDENACDATCRRLKDAGVYIDRGEDSSSSSESGSSESGSSESSTAQDIAAGVNEIKERIDPNGCDAACRRLKEQGVYIDRGEDSSSSSESGSSEPSSSESSTAQDIAAGVNEIKERIDPNGCDAACRRLKEQGVYIDRGEDSSSSSESGSSESSSSESSTAQDIAAGVNEIKERIDPNGCDAACRRLKEQGVYIDRGEGDSSSSTESSTAQDIATGVNEIRERIDPNGCDAACRRLKEAGEYIERGSPDSDSLRVVYLQEAKNALSSSNLAFIHAHLLKYKTETYSPPVKARASLLLTELNKKLKEVLSNQKKASSNFQAYQAAQKRNLENFEQGKFEKPFDVRGLEKIISQINRSINSTSVPENYDLTTNQILLTKLKEFADQNDLGNLSNYWSS